MATSLYIGQIPFRVKGQTNCAYHKGGQLGLYCEECKQLACINCLSTVHKKHSLCSLRELTPQKKEDIQNFIDKTENFDLVQINQYITSTDKQLQDNASNFEKLAHQLQTQTNKLKHDLDLLTAQTLSLYQQIEGDNTKLLQTYIQDLEMHSAQLKQQVQDCKKVLQRGSDIQIYDTGCEIQSPVTLPVKPTLGTASFSPNQNHQCHLKQALGKVDISGQGLGRSVDSSVGQGLLTAQPQEKLEAKTTSPHQKSAGRKAVSSLVFMHQTKVVGELKSPSRITSLCPTPDGQVWTSFCDSNTLTLLDRKDEIIQEVRHNNRITDINLSLKTNTLWVCDWENNITELVSGQLVHRFSTKETTQCICITASNNIIVGMAKSVSKFTPEGNLVLTTSATGTRKPLVCYPYRIAECPVTHNVAVADWGSLHHGGEVKPRVVVIDPDFKELFVYDGEVPHTHQPKSQSGGELFNPHGVVYDSVGNLLIGDCKNNRILLITGRGEFLRVIHTDDYRTFAVGLDIEDVLFAVFVYDSVKLLQYSSM